MRFTRVIVTAHDEYWLDVALREFCGYGTSVIACDAEVGVGQMLEPAQTPDNRIGAAVLMFAFSREALQGALVNRAGQCLMTCPTTALYNGLELGDSPISMGRSLRYFGDGYQRSKWISERRYWRIPVMEGEFLVEESAGVAKGVAGGNFLIQAQTQQAGLDAARAAVAEIAAIPSVITPFPGGVVRSGSKVGSRYRQLRASTYDAFCPTLRGLVETRLADGVQCVYEIVIDGVDEASVGRAMEVGIRAAAGPQIAAISAGNYGGKLGKHLFQLHTVLSSSFDGSGVSEA